MLNSDDFNNLLANQIKALYEQKSSELEFPNQEFFFNRVKKQTEKIEGKREYERLIREQCPFKFFIHYN